ncbi:MAG: pentapeptide repeat-containing protein [Pseudanabaenaceae cyanobacterium SKYGB_i_bin29]|nr:pentapeptide repeat-containing protein [Pseudanabaenaceae cyanobacterium SKYG29]MDW8420937.1 pentapeptide repeat-containing protein [Pseudanabaenaceae cyanobacterium SKYGB_i_bin29]
MAKAEYLQILEQGLDEWNRWRREHPDTPVDLRSADLSGRDLSYADLTDVDLSGADLSGSNLRNANLSTANLSHANLNGCFLGEADLSGTNLFSASLHGSYLRGAYMFGADLTEADLSETDISEAHLRNAHLSKANLANANLFGTNLYSADLGGANLVQADLSICNLMRSNFYGADLNEAILRAANLTRANLMRANLFKVDLSGATLVRARLSRAYLGSVDFSHADLRFADLSYTDITGANFLDADLRYADLSYCDLMKAYICGTQAMGTNFTGTQFTGVCLENWEVDSDTRLENVECEYIYLKSKVERPQGLLTRLYEDRYPPADKFKPEEFVRMFQKTRGYVSLVFHQGIDWEAFAQTFQDMQNHNPDAKMSITSIKNKGDGTVVIKMTVAGETDRSRLHDEFMLSYELLRKALDEEYQARADQDWIEVIGFSREPVPYSEYINTLFWGVNRLSSVHRATSPTNELMKQRRTVAGMVGAAPPPTVIEQVTVLQPEDDITIAITEVKHILDEVLSVYSDQSIADRMAGIAQAAELVHQHPSLRKTLATAVENDDCPEIQPLVKHPLFHLLLEALQG